MNFNPTQFLIQAAALSVWIFLAAGVYAVIEKLVRGDAPPPAGPHTN